ncbi:hypothetical protein K469DRAFT_690838 [Zopfia rhizophila CBS 207.26]|uniref:Uncharacterized protein n=1 Tax=Zopfia rhizophila CBS 207.26 TaxID=1314779 RepID=A0A6A6DW06_9PEZI|nr:hypothetical protein K469DRAFT_690838 [Zopfia rhizophila CBS 207.26]
MGLVYKNSWLNIAAIYSKAGDLSISRARPVTPQTDIVLALAPQEPVGANTIQVWHIRAREDVPTDLLIQRPLLLLLALIHYPLLLSKRHQIPSRILGFQRPVAHQLEWLSIGQTLQSMKGLKELHGNLAVTQRGRMDNHNAKALTGKRGPQWDPQALLAAEALGLGPLVSPVRINEAIIALDGEESVRWDNFKILLGFRAQGTVKNIRNSTALTQFFLVATACKLCCTDAELGDVFFDIISESGVLNLFPVASSQLSKLIGTFSGYSDRILPVNFMHKLAVAVDGCSGNRAFYQRMENSRLATLICKIFEYLRDDFVEYISLTGCLSGLWLATAFSWLLPDKTGIFVGGQLVKGASLATPTINLTKDTMESTNFETRAWQIQTWLSEGDPTTFVLENKEQIQNRGISELPIKLAKSFFHHNYILPISDPNGTGRREAIEAIGELAGALVTYTTENGHIYVSKRCCSDPALQKAPCSRVTLLSLQKENWIESYARSVVDYGWDVDSAASDGRTSALEAIEALFSADIDQWNSIPVTQQVNAFKNRLKAWATKRSKEWKGDSTPCLPDSVVECAIQIAAHAVASSLCNVESGHLKMGFSTRSMYSRLGNQSGRFGRGMVGHVGANNTTKKRFTVKGSERNHPEARLSILENLRAIRGGFGKRIQLPRQGSPELIPWRNICRFGSRARDTSSFHKIRMLGGWEYLGGQNLLAVSRRSQQRGSAAGVLDFSAVLPRGSYAHRTT